MLELLILTASRSGELHLMQGDEIDFSSSIWTVPAARIKAKIIGRVPLSQKSIQILGAGLRNRRSAKVGIPVAKKYSDQRHDTHQVSARQ